MWESIEKKGIEKGIEFYKKHIDLTDYYMDKNEIIVAGYRLLGVKMLKMLLKFLN